MHQQAVKGVEATAETRQHVFCFRTHGPGTACIRTDVVILLFRPSIYLPSWPVILGSGLSSPPANTSALDLFDPSVDTLQFGTKRKAPNQVKSDKHAISRGTAIEDGKMCREVTVRWVCGCLCKCFTDACDAVCGETLETVTVWKTQACPEHTNPYIDTEQQE